MAASPRYKIHDSDGEYVGSAKYPVLAAAFVSTIGDGAYVKAGGRIVWKEGFGERAYDSYDNAAVVIEARERGET